MAYHPRSRVLLWRGAPGSNIYKLNAHNNVSYIVSVHLSQRPARKDREKMEEKKALTQEQKEFILKALNDPDKREALITFLKNEEQRLAALRLTQASR